MSLIFPKKPLYAPMLGTLGGGSARGFGRGGGAGGLYDFTGFYFDPVSTTANGNYRIGLNALSDYYNSTYGYASQTVAATTQNPDNSNNPYLQIGSNNKIGWWVPQTRTYNFIMEGGQGGTNFDNTAAIGGAGAKVEGTISLNEGDMINIVVGLCHPRLGNSSNGGGGGGASYISKQTTTWIGNSSSDLIVIAGGGGGCGGPGWNSGSQGIGGGAASYDLYGKFNVQPKAGASMVLNGRSGGGGLGGNSSGWNGSMSPPPIVYRYSDFQLDGSGTVANSYLYNGSGGGGGWLQDGGPGGNSSGGGESIYLTAKGGTGQNANENGAHGGGGGGRNVTGGGGGGYIGGSSGYYASGNWPSNSASAGAGGTGGTSYFNSSYGSATGSLGRTPTLSTNYHGYVHIW